LQNLESILFYKNNFDTIPADIFELASLTELDFYYNSIEEIPAEIDRLEKLKMLYISYNQISVIPESLKDISSLQKLYIHHNQLIGLPPWIVNFKNLEILDVGYNKLAVLPDFSPAISLTEVDVQSNNLSEVPWSILNLPKLDRVFLKDNPFELSEEESIEFKELVESLMEKGVRVSF
jgi:Leucine-rich repeat (LRR) protein